MYDTYVHILALSIEYVPTSGTRLIDVGGLSVICQRVNELRGPSADCGVGGRPELEALGGGYVVVIAPNNVIFNVNN